MRDDAKGKQMTKLVMIRQEGAIAVLTLNMPEKRNPISEPEMVKAIVSRLDELNADTTIKVAILTGSGTVFSSGGDVRAMVNDLESRRQQPARTVSYYTEGIQRIPLAFSRLEVPVIAAVNGPASGRAATSLACPTSG